MCSPEIPGPSLGAGQNVPSVTQVFLNKLESVFFSVDIVNIVNDKAMTADRSLSGYPAPAAAQHDAHENDRADKDEQPQGSDRFGIPARSAGQLPLMGRIGSFSAGHALRGYLGTGGKHRMISSTQVVVQFRPEARRVMGAE